MTRRDHARELREVERDFGLRRAVSRPRFDEAARPAAMPAHDQTTCEVFGCADCLLVANWSSS